MKGYDRIAGIQKSLFPPEVKNRTVKHNEKFIPLVTRLCSVAVRDFRKQKKEIARFENAPTILFIPIGTATLEGVHERILPKATLRLRGISGALSGNGCQTHGSHSDRLGVF